jgi:hypothetical protein
MRAGVTALAVVATAWVALLLAAPILVASGNGDSGSGWWVAALYHGTSRICHQQMARSFLWAGVPFPVCGRCLALYASGAIGVIGAAAAAWTTPGWLVWPSDPFRWLLAFGTPAVLLFLMEWSMVDPGTPARAVGSLPLGLMVGWLVGRELAGARR